MKVSTIYNRSPRYAIYYAMAFGIIAVISLAFFNLYLALFLFAVWITLAVNFYKLERQFVHDMEEYVLTMERRIKRSETHAMSHLPFGVIVVDGDGDVAWFNDYISKHMKLAPRVGETITDSLVDKLGLSGQEKGEILDKGTCELNDHIYKIDYIKQEGIIYITDVTDYDLLQDKFYRNNLVLGFLQLDNLDEISKDLNEQDRAQLLTEIISMLFEWAKLNKIYIRRYQDESFLLVMNTEILQGLEEEKFKIMDEIRELETTIDAHVTISIGIAAGHDEIITKKAKLAQEGLDLALTRGGDQVAIKRDDKVQYYGGRTDAVEKRTKVRARVMAHSMREQILQSDNVYIMPHINPDADAIGSALGVLAIVQSVGKLGHIVLDRHNSSIVKILAYLEDHGMGQYILLPEDALANITRKSLLICVDHNKPSLSVDKRLLTAVNNVIVLDHHRRTEEIIENSSLLYIEPSASSTSEIVTELIEYQYRKVRLSQLVATVLMAGITVDTKNFSYMTGSRTFEAASYLRRAGADATILNKLLSDDMELYQLRSEIVSKATIDEAGFAIAKTNYDPKLGHVITAQVANTLIGMDGVKASFVLHETERGVNMSARSHGDINVQLIMEELGGGGHLTTAAAQLADVSADEAEVLLIQAIDKLGEK